MQTPLSMRSFMTGRPTRAEAGAASSSSPAALDQLLAGGDTEVGDQAQPLLDGDPHLAPGEVHAQAPVRAVGEAHVVVALAVDDELLAALPVVGIAVGRRHQPIHHVALLELDAVERDVARDLAAVAEDDGVVA